MGAFGCWLPSFSLPWLVPRVQPIELFFFQRVFYQLCKLSEPTREQDDHLQESWASIEVDEDQEVPLVVFQRAMVRLFRVLKDNEHFDAVEYDKNENGKVGWFEFCSLWKERGIYVRLTLAERIFLTLEDGDRSILGKIWSVLIFIAILVSTGSFIVSTLPEMQQQCPVYGSPEYLETCKPHPKEFFKTIDLVCVVLFSVEYLVRLVLSAFMRSELVDGDKTLLLKWMITDDAINVPSRLRRMMQWALSFSNIIDLMAVVPWYLTEAIGSTGDSDENVILKIIRLTRVIRAFRLGRRFEAVVIIVRSVRRSLRALYVLVLNLFLGMIIFGAFMYFAEQGTWDSDTQAYVRQQDPTTLDRSPFESIPLCFWWALVTATTVGYGDDHTPTTPPGKMVACLTMVWSLCVLALPIGVIGTNFSMVWDEYDTMKRKEVAMRKREETMLRQSVAWGDPLHYSRKLLIEVWHDAGLFVGNDPLRHDALRAEFLGEVDFTMELPPGEPLKRRCSQPLAANREKARRKVSGRLTFEYSWEPRTKSHPDGVLEGRLQVTVVKAEDLLNIDWKGSGVSDPYCLVIAYPTIATDGSIDTVTHRTETIMDSTNPSWDQTVHFDVCWTRDASQNGLVAEMRHISREISKRGQCHDRNDVVADAGGAVRAAVTVSQHAKVLPQLREEVERLKETVPRLHKEIGEAERDMQLILHALKSRRHSASVELPRSEPPEHECLLGSETLNSFRAEERSLN